MEAGFWHQRWENNQIAFHEGAPNQLLVEHLKTLSLAEGDRLFLPLCGKTRDIAWLMSRGYRVSGSELSKTAVDQLFAELGIVPTVSAVGGLEHYAGKNIDIFVGDFFELTAGILGPIDATYDRAALVALPETMRDQYAAQLSEITNQAQQLLLCFEYEQSLLPGPPFSIGASEVARLYDHQYHLNLIASVNVAGGLKGKCPATEVAWLLLPELESLQLSSFGAR